LRGCGGCGVLVEDRDGLVVEALTGAAHLCVAIGALPPPRPELAAASRENQTLFENLTATQERCTSLLLELRAAKTRIAELEDLASNPAVEAYAGAAFAGSRFGVRKILDWLIEDVRRKDDPRSHVPVVTRRQIAAAVPREWYEPPR
jgi:hypothetical protein